MPAPANVPPFLASVLASEKVDEGSLLHTPGLDSTQANYFPVRNGPSKKGDVDPKVVDRIQSSQSNFQKDAFEMMQNSPQSTLLVPPLNFDMVCTSSHRLQSSTIGGSAIYRSGFPNERNYPFLKSLHLRSIVYLSSDEIRQNLKDFIHFNQGSQIQLFHFPLVVNKEPFQEMDLEIVLNALRVILDKRNHPILLHCNKGKYRVGVMTALIRRLQGWNMTSIYDEYARFAGSDRIADEEFIDMFPLAQIRPDLRYTPDWYISHR